MKKALVVVTNHGSFDKVQRATGLWLSEAVHFQAVLETNGIAVDYASPRGGYVPVDPASLAPEAMDEACWRYWNDPVWRDRYLACSLAPDELDASDYDAVYFAGGHGALWDLPGSTGIAAVAQEVWRRGGVVASVCHGVVGLLALHNPDGTPFVDEKHLTGFSNEEEAANGLSDAVPFSAEDALTSAGAGYNSGKPFSVHVVRDKNLVTGQNPRSAATVGRKVAKILLGE